MTINFNEDYILENDKVHLRPLLTSDIENLCEFSEHEPELCKFSLIAAAGKDNLKECIKIETATRRLHKELKI
jgi:N-acetyltransferase